MARAQAAFLALAAAAAALQTPAPRRAARRAPRRTGPPTMALGGLAPELRPCSIKVIGVGGGGSNAVNRMVESSIRGVEFWVRGRGVVANARWARALTAGVVTKPFGFEGRKRSRQAIEAIERLEGEVDTLIVVSNDKLLSIGIVGISEIIVKPGLINVDFADVRAVMKDAGAAHHRHRIGAGGGAARRGRGRVAIISSPLLEVPVLNAKGIVFNIIGGPTMTLAEVDAAQIIYENVDADANIIFGARGPRGEVLGARTCYSKRTPLSSPRFRPAAARE
ncbi:ftsZ-like GTPase [Aureococcus anophagefferens]|uniref:FtsZ-like GTPase n=1 Tax=Aureococcus anophagefferens TaxID=44056 RepID=A0ABR1G7M4_AURAN